MRWYQSCHSELIVPKKQIADWKIKERQNRICVHSWESTMCGQEFLDCNSNMYIIKIQNNAILCWSEVFFCLLFRWHVFSLLMQIVMIFQSAPPWHFTVFQFILVEALSVWSQVIWPLWNSFVNDLSYGSNVLLISTNLLPVLHKF